MSKYAKIVATLGVITGLGIASLPVATFAAPIALDGSVPATQNVVVQLTVGDAVAVSADNGTANGGNAAPNQAKNATSGISYATNAANGMVVNVKDVDEDTNMTVSGHTGTVAGTDVIAAGTTGSTAGSGSWSIKGGLLTADTAMVKQSETALKVAESNGPVNTNLNMTYNIATGGSQLPGTYQDTIVYTVVAK
ncbi:hypothetical protein JEO88_02920 [Candidatus Saccharibacteria bacterium]|jgi:hypothetical protein|nr:hypothetical protein [Candidatus Saccharibacteria bacterium]MBB1531351.1 hypothetical protein [Candidatus Saccharibacteria bacterium]MBB1549890.1 hypothetical protein [Candidatus Saccharibacteria bacterium]MBI1146922.1 hypothetical protein [Candidatus Saccharibacteria bacterium]